uniref:Galectin n=1 Tax=Sinocyclocheilus anshuiensis TaxID=1608454 RepID=A0A671RYT3_9TELE
MCVYICVYIYIYIYTYIHTYFSLPVHLWILFYEMSDMKSVHTECPITSPIEERLQDGMNITVCGRVPSDSNRFQVELQYGSDIILHFNPRYESGGYVVHNTLQNSSPRKFNFCPPSISANGKPFSEYKHRLPFSHVNSICVDGLVEVNLIAFQDLAVIRTLFIYDNYCYDRVPYKSIIHGGLQPGKAIIIQGVISHSANRFLNLHHKTGVAFYYSPRFDTNVVVCSSYENGKKAKEKQSKDMPFELGKPFLVTIYCKHQHYEVFVSGKQVHTYKHHHTKLEDIDVLDISGDVRLSFVQP